MRRLPLCFFLIAVAVPLVFADGGAFAISRVIPSNNSDTTTTATSRATANTVSRASVSRVTTPAAGTSVTNSANNSNTVVTTARDATTRNVVSRSATTATGVNNSDVVRVGGRVLNLGDDAPTSTPRGTYNTVASTGNVSRASATQSGHTNTARENLTATVNTVGRNARVQSASVNNNPAVRRAGLTLRPSTAEVGGRATIAGTDIQTGSNIDEQIRGVQSRAATVTPTAESIAEATERMQLTTDLNSSCQQQYNDCMDQFCNVIDSNQGRCSCSANLSDYADVEEAVTSANNQLNEVAQRIRYVGLSADEIRAIMNETEAEEALSGARDTSETRSMLDEIEELIRDPSTATSSYSSTSTSFGLDMNLDFSSNVADMFSLDFLNTGTTSFSNLRGTSLYNAAKNRCKTILNECEAAGANIDQITANYDLAVDRDCIAYEQGLSKMNDTLVSNVRSANLMLQKARLAVMQNKNQYDAKGCIAALDTCMTDEMVCGEGYTKCLDPTKRYIDENGEVVLGQDITDITDFMADYNNATIDKKYLEDAYGASTTLDETYCADAGDDGRCVAKYLLQKIGTKQDVTDEGLCRAVLDKCQAYTYDDNGNYLPYNDVVLNYVQRAMVNIRAAQSQIISDYSSNCILDVATCYNQQVTQVNSWTSSASVGSIYNVMRGACRNVALTCAYAVFDGDTASEPGTGEVCSPSAPDVCIEKISEMFYQSLLCPDNSVYDNTCEPGNGECTNEMCRCINGYEPVGAYCYVKCEYGSYINGTCTCDDGYAKDSNGVCVKETTN